MSEYLEHLVGPHPTGDVQQQSAPPRFHSFAEVAKAFGRSPRTVRWWVKTGHIKAIKIGRARYVTAAEIARLTAAGQA